MTGVRSLGLYTLPDIPSIQAGDDLPKIIFEAIQNCGLELENGDILVIAQKIVSKAEGRIVNLTTIEPSKEARELAVYVEKRPELVELILRESREVLRARPGTLIVEHKCGFVCANAGIDHSNVMGAWGNPQDWVLLLPEDPDLSAEQIRSGLESRSAKKLGVLIIDSHGRAWRNGIVGATIGVANVPALVDMRGKPDLYDYSLKVTTIAAADELAAGASLMMGQAAEGTPVVLAKGFPYPLRPANLAELIRDKKFDLFR